MRRVIILVFILLAVLCSICLIYMVANEGFDSLEPLENDEYYRVLTDEKVPRSDLSSFQVTESALILYYDTAGLVNVYTLSGEFLYGIQIQTIQNGIGDFIFQDNTLYIMSRGNRMYIFHEKELVKSFLHNESAEEFRQIEQLMTQSKKHSVGDTTYYHLSEPNQIAKNTPTSGMETVISLPQANRNIRPAALFLLIMLAAFMHYLKHSKESL